MEILTDLSPVVIPIFALLIPICYIISWAVVKVTRLKLMHETVQQLAKNGQPIPPELLTKLTDDK